MTISGRSIAALIVACLLVLPWFFGGVLPQHWCWVFPLAGVAVLLDLVTVPRRVICWRDNWPIWCGVLLGILQLVQWSPNVAKVVAPAAASWRAETLAEGTAATTRTLYAPSTRETVGLLVLAGVFFQLGGRHLTLKAVCIAGTVLGTVLSLFALVQQFTWQGELYWSFPLTTGGQVFGPYVNRNNAVGLLNMCLACSAGWLVLSRVGQASSLPKAVGQVSSLPKKKKRSTEPDGQDKPGRRPTSTEKIGRLKTGPTRKTGRLEAYPTYGPTMLVAAACMGIMLAAIVASASRGGTLAAAAALLVGLLVGLRTKTPTVFVGSVVLLGVGLLFIGLLDLQETLMARWAETAANDVKDGRIANWRDSLKSVPYSWLWGSGLGAYRFPSRLFETHNNGELWYMFAENQYVQSLVDGGIVALGLLLAMIGVVAAAVVRLVRRRTGTDVAVATLGAMALASQMVAGAFDFGLYHAANALWMATICGLVVGLRRVEPKDSECARTEGWLARWIGGGVLLALLFVLGRDVFAAGMVDRAIRGVSEAEVLTTREPKELAEWLERMQRVAARRPDDERAHNTLSALWSQQIRLGMLARLRTLQPWGNEESQYIASTPRQLAQLNLELAADGSEPVASSPVVQDLVGLTGSALVAVRCCPWDWRHQLRMAEVVAISKDTPAVPQYLEHAERVAGGSPRAWYECGQFYGWIGERDRNLACWARSLTLSSSQARAIARNLSAEDWEALISAAEQTTSGTWPLSPQAMFGLMTALRQERRNDEVPQLFALTQTWPSIEKTAKFDELGYLAEVHWLGGDQEEALRLVRRAKSDPKQGSRWQVREIQILIELDELHEAETQLQRAWGISGRTRESLRKWIESKR